MLARVGRRTVYDWLERDANFRALYNDALKDASDALEREARRRAVEGVLRQKQIRDRMIRQPNRLQRS